MRKRPICTVGGCSSQAMANNKHKDGSYSYRKLCTTHHRKKYKMTNMSYAKRKKLGETLNMDRSSCILCGWDKAPCDRHRIKYGCNGGTYTLGNTVSLCPNCHRLIHMDLIRLK